MIRLAVILCIGATLLSGEAAAQRAPRLFAGATFAGVRSVAQEGGARQVSQGMVFGGKIGVRAGAFALTGSYLDGTIRPTGSQTDLGFVEGSAAAAVRLTPWLQVGTSVRVHRADDVTPERWLFWGATARVEVPILGDQLRGHAAYDQGLGGKVNLPAGGVTARSGEVGLTMALPGTPFAIDLASLVEEEGAGGRTRMLQHLALTLEWSSRGVGSLGDR
jgi:hypothetical protein